MDIVNGGFDESTLGQLNVCIVVLGNRNTNIVSWMALIFNF
jgi:hypothetical protein